MNLDEFVRSGGASIWHLSPRGTSSTHLWDVGNVFGMGRYFDETCQVIWKGFPYLLVAMFFAEVSRLYLSDEVKSQWKFAVFKLLLMAALFAGYSTVVWTPAQVADKVLQSFADDAACNEALFTFMTTAERGMLATFNPTGGAGVAMINQTPENLLQGVSYLLFYLAWWIIPICILGVLLVLYVLGPYCLAFFVFKPTSGIAGMWAKMLGGMFFAYVLICFSFFLVLGSQTFNAASSTNAISDPFSTIGFSLAGILVAFSMPSYAVRLMGGRMSFFPGKP